MDKVSPCATCGKLVLPGSVVAVPAEEYRRLLAAAEAEKRRSWNARRIKFERSAIRRNAALAEFILSQAGSFTLEQIVAACRERFGRDAPSRSAVHRFLRVEQSKSE